MEEQYAENNEKLIINYLLKNDKTNVEPSNSEGIPLFLFEFYVFDMVVPDEILILLKNPMLTFRLMDYPTQTIFGAKDTKNSKIVFRTGKCCYFEMEIEHFKHSIKEEPLYIMLVDSFQGEMKLIATSKVNVSIFGYDQFCQFSGKPPLPRRNVLKLFDNLYTTICEFDISMLIRREYFKYNADKRETELYNAKQNNDRSFYEKNCLDESRDSKLDRSLVSPIVNHQTITSQSNPITTSIREKSHNNVKSKSGNNIKPERVSRGIGTQKSTKLHKVNSDVRSNQLITDHNFSQSNQIKQRQHPQSFVDPCSKKYVNDLKELMQGGSSNPPPLYFHCPKKRRESPPKLDEQTKVNHIIVYKSNNEFASTSKEIEQNFKNKIKNESSTEQIGRLEQKLVNQSLKSLTRDQVMNEKKPLASLSNKQNNKHRNESRDACDYLNPILISEKSGEYKYMAPVLEMAAASEICIIGRHKSNLKKSQDNVLRSSEFYAPSQKSLKYNPFGINDRYMSKISIDDFVVDEFFQTPKEADKHNPKVQAFKIEEELKVSEEKSIGYDKFDKSSIKYDHFDTIKSRNNAVNAAQSLHEDLEVEEVPIETEDDIKNKSSTIQEQIIESYS